jgi:hypothetical protein
MPVNGVALGAVAAGAVMVYGGLSNKSPLKALQAIVQGKAPSSVAGALSLWSVNNGTPTPITGPEGPGAGAQTGGTPQANQAIAQLLCQPYGWSGGQEWSDLISLWDRESGWRNTADTRVSGAGGDTMSSSVFAYGIAQARPATKYPKAGQPPDHGGTSDAKTQIAWGLQYIKSSYGSVSAAWAHETANSWY